MGKISASIDMTEGKSASAVATNYVTDITSDGVFVHTADNASLASGSGVHIGASVIRILKTGIEYIKAWVANDNAYVRIGAENIDNVDQGNVLIDEDSIDIRKGDTVLSTFTSTGASLGKNSDTAEIGMCDNQFKISSGVIDGYFTTTLSTRDDANYELQALSFDVEKESDGDYANSTASYTTQISDTGIGASKYLHETETSRGAYLSHSGIRSESHVEEGGVASHTNAQITLSTQAGTTSTIQGESSIYLYATASGDEQIWLSGNVLSYNNVKVLWTGAYYMTSGHTATFTNSQKVSEQLNGIVLVWSAYSNSTAQDYDWTYYFVPKWHVAFHEGQSVDILMMNNTIASNVMCRKLVYVYDDRITGNDNNTATGTGYANNAKVLRAVIGV